MYTFGKIDWQILDAVADDWENLEQVYQMICFDFSAEIYENHGSGAFFLRPTPHAPLLEEIADRICALVEAGLLEVRLDGQDVTALDLNDRSYVWRGWFQMTARGKSVWQSSELESLVEQEPII